MTLVEKHVVRIGDKRFPILDDLCFRSKNLYNSTLYKIRQHFFNTNKYCGWFPIQKEFQDSDQPDYRALPSKVSQQTMRLVDQNFKSFFNALTDYLKNPGKYKGKPRIPGYLDSLDGRFVVVYTYQSVSKKEFRKNGRIKLEKLPSILIPTKVPNFDDICQVRIVHRGSHIVIEVVYEKSEKPGKPDNGRYAGIDLGVNNLVTLTTNLEGEKPIVYSGRPIKSWNHYYNKEVARLKGILGTVNKGKRRGWSKRLSKVTFKREMKINDYFHKVTRDIVNYLVSKHINTLIVGNNKGWKQNTNLGKIGNQNFIQIPFYKLLSMLSYKCKFEGINLVIITEEYTSRCSFLDNEPIQKQISYLGKRVHRGLFISSTGVMINADVNGSYNIIKKCKPNAFSGVTSRRDGVMGVVVHPIIKFPYK